MTNNKFLTIAIVTKDREKEFDRCIGSLIKQPLLDQCHVIVVDNSTSEITRAVKLAKLNELSKYTTVEFVRWTGFLESRNRAVRDVNTPYFTIMDDDDYYLRGGIKTMIETLKENPVEFLGVTCLKEGRPTPTKTGFTRVPPSKKLQYLNRFDNYEKDRLDKIFLWNAANVYSRELVYGVRGDWRFEGCDDILPVTSMYLRAKTVGILTTPCYGYSVQQSVTSDRDSFEVLDLVSGIEESYRILNERFGSNPKDKLILDKAARNSYLQVKLNNGVEIKGLSKLFSIE